MGKIGAHVSASGGLTAAVDRGVELTLECLQVFVGAPQNWTPPSLSDEQVTAFTSTLDKSGLGPAFVHGPYLINLASLRPDVRAISGRTLVDQLKWSERLGTVGVIVHIGSGGDDALDVTVQGLMKVLERYTGSTRLILENDAGSGHRVGSSFAEIGKIIRLLDGDPRLGVCLDTAHSLAAGYEIRTEGGLDAAVAEIESEIGLDRVLLLHVNDSKTELRSNVDRHANLGRGTIGVEAFARILGHPKLAHLPFVLEVPGYDGEGPDRPNVDLLRLLATGRIAEIDTWKLTYAAEIAADRSTAPRPSSRSGKASSG